MDLHSLTREQLYDMVWRKPLIVLAPEFGVSDVAVKKRCKRLGVPTPGPGYWAKIEAGIRPHKTKLPDSIPAAVRRRKNPDSMVYFEVEGANYCLPKPHPFVSPTKQALRGDKPDERGLIHAYGPCVHMGISKVIADRAMWVLSHLLKALERHEVSMQLKDGYGGGLVLNFKDVSLNLYISEAVREFPNPAYDPNMMFRILDRIPSKIYRCSGRLRIHAKASNGYSKDWIDKPTRSLDSSFKQVASEIVDYLSELADLNEQQREREHFYAEKRRIAWLNQQEREAEEKRLRSLEHLASQFELSRQVAQLANEVAEYIRSCGLNPADAESVDTWLQWARAHSSTLNPVQKVVTSLLSETPIGE